jgi:parvulin-like peptidyl-prolyl isomerase
MVLFFALACALPWSASAGQDNRVVAVVNGAPLTTADLNQEIWKLLPESKGFHGNISKEKMEKIRSESMLKLVESELQRQDAVAKGMMLGAAELKAEIEKLSSRFRTKREFQAAIEGSGFDEKEFDRFVERNVLSQRIRAAEVDDRVRVPDAAVKEHYDKNSSRYSKPQEYRASQILIKVDPAASEEERSTARARAEAMLKRIKQGAAFADVAAAESDDLTRIKGGDMGYFHAGQTMAEFEEALAKLKVGETGGLVETIYGYHIIMLTDKREPRQIPFEEMRAKINAELVAAEKQRLTDLWMSGLKARAVINYPGEK